MRNAIAVMNTKGGVGKSTLVLALAETLSAWYGKRVLVIDSDAQASVSYMLAGPRRLNDLQAAGRTIVSFLAARVLRDQRTDWRDFVVGDVSDIEDAPSIELLPSDTELTLFERVVSRNDAEARLRQTVAGLLADVRPLFDVVLVDCPPGLSIVTECWLREADFHLAPTRPDFISACGLTFFRRFKSRNPDLGFAANIGVLVTMKDKGSSIDEEYHRWLADDPENNCFETVLMRSPPMQHAAAFVEERRSYLVKYPGEAGDTMRRLAREVLERMEAGAADPSPAYSDQGAA